MKELRKYIFAVAVLFAASFPSRAQENFRIGISGFPLNAASMYDNGYIIGSKDYIADASYNTSIKGIYSDIEGRTYSTGTITLEYGFRMDGGYEISLNAGFDLLWQEFKNGYSEERSSTKKALATYFIPMFRFYFVEKENVRFYTGAGVGVTFYCGFDKVEFPVRPSAQWTPFGFEAGKDIFLFGETGLGTMFNGGRIGLGFRF